MKIEIHIKDTKPNGRRVGPKFCFVESCRVYREAGDGILLDNLATAAYAFFHNDAVEFARAVRESRFPRRAAKPEEVMEATK